MSGDVFPSSWQLAQATSEQVRLDPRASTSVYQPLQVQNAI